MEPWLIASLSVLSLLIAGTVKGAMGLGLPTTAIALLTLFLEARTAIGLMVLPILFSNAWQTWRSGDTLRALSTYRWFAVTTALGVAATLWFSRNAPEEFLLGVLGAVMLLFVMVNLTKWRPMIPDGLDRRFQIGLGLAAGIMGGLTSVWAPPLAIYLAARGVKKDEFIRVSGLMFLLGGIPLAVGYFLRGAFVGQQGLLSLLMILPTFVGFTVGEHLRGRMSETLFRQFLLLVFFLMGLNLLRRALL